MAKRLSIGLRRDRVADFARAVDGSYTTIDVPGALATAAFGINAAGQIVRAYVDAGGQLGFLATPQP